MSCIDVEYALGELSNIQTELEAYFGKDGIFVEAVTLTAEGIENLTARLEGVEARIREQDEIIDRLTRAFETLLEGVAYTPAYSADQARDQLGQG